MRGGTRTYGKREAALGHRGVGHEDEDVVEAGAEEAERAARREDGAEGWHRDELFDAEWMRG